ncbi:hypothetical protein EK21DRAFT_86512 [Setomelanomma holmii]|uniref:EthD domain-containing protein n=1 Tax=Setomelanomma holmii TaxID=210430 RepID=A0A9P4HFG1_9PLEO|nr:hypothetical protein EK21DRAFT_86512 [Setomelanomma holmii]
MTDAAEQGCIQIVTYIRRRRDLTQRHLYELWENVHAHKVILWAEKHGIQRYQQIHVTGSLVPIAATASAPNALSTGELPITAIEFDGIAMFLVPSLKQFTEAFRDPYYVAVIEPDEREFLDKEGPGIGVIASFQGKMVDMVCQGKSTAEGNGKSGEYRKLFEEFENRTR